MLARLPARAMVKLLKRSFSLLLSPEASVGPIALPALSRHIRHVPRFALVPAELASGHLSWRLGRAGSAPMAHHTAAHISLRPTPEALRRAQLPQRNPVPSTHLAYVAVAQRAFRSIVQLCAPLRALTVVRPRPTPRIDPVNRFFGVIGEPAYRSEAPGPTHSPRAVTRPSTASHERIGRSGLIPRSPSARPRHR